MDVIKDSEVIINLKLLKQSHFYSLIDPNGKQVFGCNIFRLIFIIIFITVHTLVIYSNVGLFVDVDYKLSRVEFFLVMFADLLNCLNGFKTCILLYQVDKIVDLLDVTRINFMTSELCRRNNKILDGHRNTIKKFSNFYCIFCSVVVTQWIFIAFLTNVFTEEKNLNDRIPNVINMPFPVNIRTYNQYYNLFFVIETTFTVFILYCILMIDTYLLSFGWIIIAQYELVALAFKDLEPKDERRNIGNKFKIFLKKNVCFF